MGAVSFRFCSSSFFFCFVSRDVRAEDLQLADVPTTDITVVRTRDPVRLDAPACEPIYAVWSFRDGEGGWRGSNAFSRSSSGSCLKKKKKDGTEAKVPAPETSAAPCGQSGSDVRERTAMNGSGPDVHNSAPAGRFVSPTG